MACRLLSRRVRRVISSSSFDVLLQRLKFFGAGGPAECEIHGPCDAMKVAAVWCDRVPEVGWEDKHQSGSREDFDVIAFADGGEIGIEAGIVQQKDSIAGIKVVCSICRLDGIMSGGGGACVVDTDEISAVIMDGCRVAGSHAVGEQQQVHASDAANSFRFQPACGGRHEHGSQLSDCGHGTGQSQQVHGFRLSIEFVIEFRSLVEQFAELSIE